MDPFEYYPQLQPVRRYVRAHISERIRLEDVAQQVDLSKAHFSRLFHKHTGVRFQDWLIQQRVEYAKQLMLTEDQRVTQVAFAVGFGSISAFERAFKKLEGMTPRSFLSKQRESVAAECKQMLIIEQHEPSKRT